MPTTLPHDDLERIRAAALRYSQGVDRLDVELMRSAYWPDAIDDHGVYVGDAMAFCEMVVRTHARYAATMHCVMNHLIEPDGDGGDVATGEIYNVSHLHSVDAEGRRWLDTWWGRYVDRYERRGGEWRIAHRTCVHEWTERRELVEPMPIDAARFRQGSADRATPR